jgi:hypothetical protein
MALKIAFALQVAYKTDKDNSYLLVAFFMGPALKMNEKSIKS